MAYPRLIADIGGTNARFAIASQPGNVQFQMTLPTSDFADVESAINQYLKNLAGEFSHVDYACLAVAGPIIDGRVAMTNCPWIIDCKQLMNSDLGSKRLTQLQLINDFEAIALSLPFLNKEQKLTLGAGKALANYPMTVLGPGTGLGAASLIPNQNQWLPIATEGGHASLGAFNDQEASIFQYWRTRGLDSACEYYLSGPGMSRVYEALWLKDDTGSQVPTAKEIYDAASSGDAKALATIEQFCAFLGSAAGDQALVTGARGGVYIAGGIGLKLAGYLQSGGFRHRFESKSVMQKYLSQIPTFLILEPDPGLLGASVALL